ncbi:MAG: M13 family metallopeptidase, partial [Acidobacteriales bacterium]|nr:M13 family metallopeptidase [Terriglobales bacterium]
MSKFRFAFALLLSGAFTAAQSTANQQPKSDTTPTSQQQESPKPLPDQVQKPVAEEHSKPGFSLDNLDRSAEPCQDFYTFACGTWIKKNPVPSDQPSWDSFTAVYDQNQKILRGIHEKAAAPDPSRNAVAREIGDFYAACMDENAANSKGISAIQPELQKIAAIKTTGDVIETAAHIELIGPNPIFGFGSQPDYHNAAMTIAAFDQSGITMPDRDYYLKDDEKTKAIRDAYVKYIEQIFTLSGDSQQAAAKKAQTVLAIETDIAHISMDRTLRRDPKSTDHPMTLSELEQIAPKLELTRYIKATNSPSFTKINVGNPDFFKGVNALIDKYPVDAWKTYLAFQLTDSAAMWLSQPFVDAAFKFQQNFTGQQEIQARWKRCVDRTDQALGEALGQRYVEEAFGPEAKARMLDMVHNLETALGQDIDTLPWMTAETKQRARVKLAAIANKIGYPDKWRDYSSIELRRDDLAGNVFRTAEFESHRQLNKIGKPVDRAEWTMTPPTVNAYYSSLENNINFPAGILQPPFFDQRIDDAVNYGGIGAVIGHEMTHGFDD